MSGRAQRTRLIINNNFILSYSPVHIHKIWRGSITKHPWRRIGASFVSSGGMTPSGETDNSSPFWDHAFEHPFPLAHDGVRTRDLRLCSLTALGIKPRGYNIYLFWFVRLCFMRGPSIINVLQLPYFLIRHIATD